VLALGVIGVAAIADVRAGRRDRGGDVRGYRDGDRHRGDRRLARLAQTSRAPAGEPSRCAGSASAATRAPMVPRCATRRGLSALRCSEGRRARRGQRPLERSTFRPRWTCRTVRSRLERFEIASRLRVLARRTRRSGPGSGVDRVVGDSWNGDGRDRPRGRPVE
jgi:hypothetical protein